MSGSSSKRVLVLGGGVAGSTVADRLACAGVDVTLVENQPLIGGHAGAMGCKAAEVCLRCNVCVAVDIFKSVLQSSRVQVITRAHLAAFESRGLASPYRAVVTTKPGFIKMERCTGCGVCLKACPQGCLRVLLPAVYGGKPVMDADACLRSKGKSCALCAKACPVNAIDLDEKPHQHTLEADALVVAVGYQPFDPAIDASFGYGSVANVITGLEAERQLVQQRRITRPSDGAAPRRIAFIQCVGSRSEHAHRRPEDMDYCSAVCCAYALRMARRLLHESEDAAVTVFYMDLQNFGKDFNAFLNAVKPRLTLIRARPYEVTAGPQDTVSVRYEDQAQGAVTGAVFDLVVLAIGIRPAPDTLALAERLRIPVDEQGFLGVKGATGLAESQRPRVFLAGACEAPKDIASSISQAESVCAAVLGECGIFDDGQAARR
ncbi:MAG: FAD-dependent oxidoreductase [Verrucomicrobia bacterium]|nr:FAD-dependent oxidoreductase [Verrucomicrobiota bacterium]MCG2680555.1 FAD-dependent oxidoreductase [Kiritimatiellia bacterium]MBU4246885.1 FAD-dependent oxidoreductase [Verrucomicrobiota bacterium]MBU4290836.1 FAD-dependent oxidoreductase [Verrucomicrobiota bacterium]MBU4429245.1 FAD-dependent oxidoreductase [Verrucomicrobiota bacterium]